MKENSKDIKKTVYNLLRYLDHVLSSISHQRIVSPETTPVISNVSNSLEPIFACSLRWVRCNVLMKVQTHFELKQPLCREYIIQGRKIEDKESDQVVTYSWYCTVFFTSSSNINSKIRFEVSVQLAAKLGLMILL
jgi:hypothetical protein